MIVDGQIRGGTAQGIGTCIYEAMLFDECGQPLAGTLADYLLPGALEIPEIRVLHMETPSPYTTFGAQGIGEGGAVGPPAAIVSAVNDALQGKGVESAIYRCLRSASSAKSKLAGGATRRKAFHSSRRINGGFQRFVEGWHSPKVGRSWDHTAH